MNSILPFFLAGIALIGFGIRGALLHRNTVQRLLSINVLGAGVFLIMIASAWRGPDQDPDSILHALVLTGIVVAVSATALGLALSHALRRNEESSE